ncbi:hypothetical protein FisN_18Hu218 [Fistulifera solaris]|uniref:Uncharacterized protein n=1 Tax=Fistulifera solaris TaxID=1519565 RepID=A0A1Z5JVC9_FISSO|nr:hypothetical protein FisN_18Hu218 [Fistulifera solaris]|eukprot:GAX18005.1 hypothetical protein FisN_18Hu218 [Fistulifera solaris]
MAFLYQILAKVVLGEINNILLKMKPAAEARDTAVDWRVRQKTDVNRFMGWALFSLRTKLHKGKRERKMDEDEKVNNGK